MCVRGVVVWVNGRCAARKSSKQAWDEGDGLCVADVMWVAKQTRGDRYE